MISILAKHVTVDFILSSLSLVFLHVSSILIFIFSDYLMHYFLSRLRFSAFPTFLPYCIFFLVCLLFHITLTLLKFTLFFVFSCFSLSSLSPIGQGASWDHPAGESQHQGGGGAQETCECCFIRDLTPSEHTSNTFSPSVTVFITRSLCKYISWSRLITVYDSCTLSMLCSLSFL